MNLHLPNRLCLGIAIILFAAASAAAEDGKPCRLTATLSRDQKIQFNFEISRERLSRQPEWIPSAAPAPLQPQQAVQAALGWYRAQHPAIADSIIVSSISLQIVSLKDFQKWFYTVNFVFDDSARKKLSNTDIGFAVVLLDGTVVVPQPKQGRPEFFSLPGPP